MKYIKINYTLEVIRVAIKLKDSVTGSVDVMWSTAILHAYEQLYTELFARDHSLIKQNDMMNDRFVIKNFN